VPKTPSLAQAAAANPTAVVPANLLTAKTQPLTPAPDALGATNATAQPEIQPIAAPTISGHSLGELSPAVEARLPDGLEPQVEPDAAAPAGPAPLAEPPGDGSMEPQARTLEHVVGELLEPVIRQWLEANLPRLVEEVVRKEVARAIAVERPASVV
jgi:cell pole-organizing protein PopZ